MFDPYGFFRVAGRLAGGDEAEMRTAAGRAYYAAFLMARDKLGVKGHDAEVHRVVIELLDSARERRVARTLHRLRRLRNTADYDTATTVTQLQADNSLALAREIIQAVGSGGFHT